jgi:hypothetical protein
VEEHGQILVKLANLALQTVPYFHSGSGSLQNVHTSSLLVNLGWLQLKRGATAWEHFSTIDVHVTPTARAQDVTSSALCRKSISARHSSSIDLHASVQL